MEGERVAELWARMEGLERSARNWRRLALLAVAAGLLGWLGSRGAAPTEAQQPGPAPEAPLSKPGVPLLRFGARTINWDKVQYVEDGKLLPRDEAEDSILVKFDSGDEYGYIYLDGDEADAMRTWLDQHVPKLVKFRPDL